MGQILIASAYSINQIAAGEVVYVRTHSGIAELTETQSFGYTGLQMLTQIVIADMTSLRFRRVWSYSVVTDC